MAQRSKKTTPGASSQLDIFDRPAPNKAPAGKKAAGTKKAGAGKKAPKRKRRLSQGEVRLYTSKSGHRYELRRLT